MSAIRPANRLSVIPVFPRAAPRDWSEAHETLTQRSLLEGAWHM